MNSKVITLRIVDLLEPMEAWCKKHRITQSDFLRAAIAEKLGVIPPVVKIGGKRAAATTDTKEDPE